MNSYELLEGIVVQLILKGDAYVYITRNKDYDVTALTLLYPGTVFYNIENDTYTVADIYNKINGTFTSDKIIHIRHKSLNTLKGDSVLTYAGKTIGLAQAADSEALSNFQNGGRFKGILSSESSLTGFGSAIDDQVDQIRDNLQAEIDSGRDILTLQSGAEFKPMSQSMRDLMITDIKNVTLFDLARYFGISPIKLSILTAGNYQSSLQDSINFFTDTLNPLLKKIEAAFNAHLIAPNLAHRYKIEFDRTTLTYYKSIIENFEKMLGVGIASVNDIRKKINKPADENGDELTISTNLQFLSNPKVQADSIEEPVTEPAKESETEENQEKEEEVDK